MILWLLVLLLCLQANIQGAAPTRGAGDVGVRHLLYSIHGDIEAGEREDRKHPHHKIKPIATENIDRCARGSRPQNSSLAIPAGTSRTADGPAWNPPPGPGHLESPPVGGRPCPEGCATHGTCNSWTGECSCPIHYSGAACDAPLLPACHLDGTLLVDPVRWLFESLQQVKPWPGTDAQPAGSTAPNVIGHSPIPCECLRQASSIDLLFERYQQQAVLDRRVAAFLCVELIDAAASGSAPLSAFLQEPDNTRWRLIPPRFARHMDPEFLEGTEHVHDTWLAGDREVPAEEVGAFLGELPAPMEECDLGCKSPSTAWCGAVQAGAGAGSGGQQLPRSCRWVPAPDAEMRENPLKFGQCNYGAMCSEHGECDMMGFCRCKPGFWGLDCRVTMGAEGRPVLADPPPGHGKLRPRVHILGVPPVYRRGEHFAGRMEIGELLDDLLLLGPYREADPFQADYFYIPTAGACEAPRADAKLRWVREQQPYWNATVASPLAKVGARHLLALFSEHGIGEAFTKALRLVDGGHSPTGIPADLAAHSDHRAYAVMQWNGRYDVWMKTEGCEQYDKYVCNVCFLKGTDIVLPISIDDVEMPACKTITKHHPWRVTAGGDIVDASQSNRTRLVSFQGRMPLNEDSTPRGILWMYFGCNHHPDVWLSNSIEDPSCPSDSVREHETSPELMQKSKFCIVPLGFHGGDARRYVPAITFGCVPVMVLQNATYTLDELLDWSAFSVTVVKFDLPRLPAILQALVDSGEYARLQANLWKVWPKLWWHNLGFIGGSNPETVNGYGSLGLGLQCDRGKGFEDDFLAPPLGFKDGVWGDVPGAFGGLMALLRNRLVDRGELPEVQRTPMLPH